MILALLLPLTLQFPALAEDKRPAADTAQPGSFHCPVPSLVNRPGFYTEGSWARQLNDDGKPLAAHSLYHIDSQLFAEWLGLALDLEKIPAARRGRVDSLRQLAALSGEAQKKAAAKYLLDYKVAATSEREWTGRQAQAALKQAIDIYSTEVAQLNYREQLRLADRIDLDGGTTAEGKLSRQRMKAALSAMDKHRLILNKSCAAELKASWPVFIDKYTDKEPSGTVAKGTRVIAMYAADDTALASYFERLGAGTFTKGAFTLTEETGFRLKERKTLKLATGENLKVCRVDSLKSASITEKDGGAPLSIPVSGWIRDDQFLPKK